MRKRGQDALAIFEVPGIGVAGGAKKLRMEASRIDGILGIDLNYILDTVSIRYDSGRVTLANIKKKIDTG